MRRRLLFVVGGLLVFSVALWSGFLSEWSGAVYISDISSSSVETDVHSTHGRDEGRSIHGQESAAVDLADAELTTFSTSSDSETRTDTLTPTSVGMPQATRRPKPERLKPSAVVLSSSASASRPASKSALSAPLDPSSSQAATPSSVTSRKQPEKPKDSELRSSGGGMLQSTAKAKPPVQGVITKLVATSVGIPATKGVVRPNSSVSSPLSPPRSSVPSGHENLSIRRSLRTLFDRFDNETSLRNTITKLNMRPMYRDVKPEEVESLPAVKQPQRHELADMKHFEAGKYYEGPSEAAVEECYRQPPVLHLLCAGENSRWVKTASTMPLLPSFPRKHFIAFNGSDPLFLRMIHQFVRLYHPNEDQFYFPEQLRSQHNVSSPSPSAATPDQRLVVYLIIRRGDREVYNNHVVAFLRKYPRSVATYVDIRFHEYVKGENETEAMKYLSSKPVWQNSTRNIFLLGDVWFSHDTMRSILDYTGSRTGVWGRLTPSKLTKKPYGELYAFSVCPYDFGLHSDVLSYLSYWYNTTKERKASGWMYAAIRYEMIDGEIFTRSTRVVNYLLKNIDSHPKHHLTLSVNNVDNLTDDFDYLQDFIRWHNLEEFVTLYGSEWVSSP